VSTPIATFSVDCGFLGFWLQPPPPSSPLLSSMASAVAHSCTLTPWSHKFHLLREPHSVSSIAPSAILRLGDAPVIARLNVARARVRTLPLVSLIAGRRRVCRFGGSADGGVVVGVALLVRRFWEMGAAMWSGWNFFNLSGYG
jgi:hypothetical protein